jgi:hypothetical protein
MLGTSKVVRVWEWRGRRIFVVVICDLIQVKEGLSFSKNGLKATPKPAKAQLA